MTRRLSVGDRWFQYPSGAVWEREGVRIHVSGMCMLPGKRMVYGRRYPESVELDRHIQMHGGNQKRGVMSWANELAGGSYD